MSIDIDYFFNSDKSFEQLLTEINELLGCSLILSEIDKGTSSCVFFAMPLSFSTSSLENDGI